MKKSASYGTRPKNMSLLKLMLIIDEEVGSKENWWKGQFLHAVAAQKISLFESVLCEL